MKTSEKKLGNGLLHKLTFTFFSLFATVMLFAQETKEIDVNINSGKSSGFFASPIVWAVGIAVFILLLVALLRGGSRKSGA